MIECLLWNEDNQDDSFIFRDDDEAGDDNYDNLDPQPEQQAHQLDSIEPHNLAAPKDSAAISKDQFVDRNDDPLNSTTTLNFKNVLREADGDNENVADRNKK